jgi:hypothetical protein
VAAETPSRAVEPGSNAWGVRSLAPSPVVNLEKLTEEVVRRIDDRILAHRERIGKVF